MKGFHDWLVEIIVSAYATVWRYIGDVMSIMTDTAWYSDPTISGVIDIVQNSINGIAYTIMIIFFFVELFAMVQKEGLTDLPEEFIYKMMIQLALTRIFIHYAPEIIKGIVDITNYWIAEIPAGVVDDTFSTGLEAAISASIPLKGSNPFTSIVCLIKQLIMGIIHVFPLIIMYVVLIIV